MTITACNHQATSNNRQLNHLPTVQVQRVTDGDTIRLSDGQRIRLCGIDGPEKAQRLGHESTQTLKRLLNHAAVKIDPIETDRYNRTVAEVWAKQPGEKTYTNINVALVRAGMAYHYAKYSANCPSRAAIVAAEVAAQSQRVGVWQSQKNMKPWQWRSLKRSR